DIGQLRNPWPLGVVGAGLREPARRVRLGISGCAIRSFLCARWISQCRRGSRRPTVASMALYEPSGQTRPEFRPPRRIATQTRDYVVVAVTFVRYGPSTAQIVAEALAAPRNTTAPPKPDGR